MNKRLSSMSVFLNEIKNKNLFCYGAGKVFEDFLNSHPDIKIVAVIDKNYRNGCIEVGNQRIPVISVETFLKEADNAIFELVAVKESVIPLIDPRLVSAVFPSPISTVLELVH